MKTEMEECKMREEIKDSSRRRVGYIEDALYGKKNILDDRGHKLGEIRTEAGKLWAYDAMLHRLGYWDQSINTTRDTAGRTIGKGNLLLNFFFKNL